MIFSSRYGKNTEFICVQGIMCIMQVIISVLTSDKFLANSAGLGWVLWHINPCRLFNARCFLYIYFKYIGFGLVGFYGISTIVGYLIPNPLYTYISNIYDLVWLGFMAYQPL